MSVSVARPRKYRSKFEQKLVPPLETLGAEYEPGPLSYPQPDADYTLDLALPNGIAVELKGWLRPEDRMKILRVHRAYPELDLRIVFQSATDKLYAGSKTTYGEWATRHGLKWASKDVPRSWLAEPTNPASLAVIDAARARKRAA
jgi:hypothetical protein